METNRSLCYFFLVDEAQLVQNEVKLDRLHRSTVFTRRTWPLGEIFSTGLHFNPKGNKYDNDAPVEEYILSNIRYLGR